MIDFSTQKLYKKCPTGDWLRTHVRFLRPGDIFMVKDFVDHLKATSKPYETKHGEVTIDCVKN